MADGSKIEWTDSTWNPITGCSVKSPGCAHCYAMGLAGGRLQHHWSREGLTDPSKAGPVWNGKVRFNEEWLDQPLRWRRPRMIFVCAHGDLFHENVPDEWIERVFAVMALAYHHRFQVLTKRPERMQEWFNSGSTLPLNIHERCTEHLCSTGRDTRQGEFLFNHWPLRNVWLGTSIEDSPRLSRVAHLRACPAPVRFLSLEPLIGPLDDLDLAGLGWVIVGGESGSKARPMHPDWARSIRDQCVAAGVPFFFKQWGEWREVDGPRCRSISRLRHPSDSWMEPSGVLHPRTRWTNRRFTVYADSIMRRMGKQRSGRLLDGVEWNEMPTTITD